MQELRLVTALFADISGFTTLADTLDTESLHEVITPLVAGLTRIAERYDGFIEKFAGDALLVVYGAPTTHEDDAQRALLTALDMHAELPRLLSRIGPHAAHLTIHVGVNTGRIIARQAGSEQQSDYAVLGDSVILAQRLESVCPPGETYVGATTYELCKEEFEFESVGELVLKGKLRPVQAHRLLGRRSSVGEQSRPLVGRSDELAVLHAALASASSGRGVAVVVSGEPGTGKSRLVAEARTHAASRGLRWLPARCLSYGGSLPYWPFVDLLRQVTGVPAQEEADVADARLAASLPAASLPGARRLLGTAADDVEPQRARREIHDAVTGWLAALAAESPVVLCVEDVHWADRATSELLGELLRSTAEVAVAVVLTARPEGLPDLAPLTADVDARAVRLDALSTSLVPDLASAMLCAPVAPGLVQLLSARTGGNPLFVEELTRSLKESGALVETPAGWDVKPGWDAATVPETIERVFATRLDALPVAAAGLLQVASVVGRTVRLSLLDAVSGAEPAGLQQLDALVDAGLLDRVVDTGEQAVTFHHALLHDVVYGRLLRKRRRELHRKVADVARGLYGDGDDSVGLLARHLYLAEAGHEAAQMLLRAGRRAAGLYANDEAALHLERAVEVLRTLPAAADELPAVVLELAEVQEVRGEYEDAYALYDEVRGLTGDVRAWRGLGAVLRKRGEYGAALAALEVAGADDPELTLERAYSLELAGRAAEAKELLVSVLRRPSAEGVLRARLLTQLASVAEGLGEFSAGRAAVDEALDLLRQADQHRLAATAHRVAGNVDLRDGRMASARAHLERAQQLATRTGMVEESAGALMTLGFLYMETRELERSVEATLQAVTIFDKLGHGSGRAVGYGNVADAMARLGRWEEAEAWSVRALEHARRIEHVGTLADTSLTLARVRCAQHRWDEAQVCAEQAALWFRQAGCEQQAAEALQLVSEATRGGGERAR